MKVSKGKSIGNPSEESGTLAVDDAFALVISQLGARCYSAGHGGHQGGSSGEFPESHGSRCQQLQK